MVSADVLRCARCGETFDPARESERCPHALRFPIAPDLRARLIRRTQRAPLMVWVGAWLGFSALLWLALSWAGVV